MAYFSDFFLQVIDFTLQYFWISLIAMDRIQIQILHFNNLNGSVILAILNYFILMLKQRKKRMILFKQLHRNSCLLQVEEERHHPNSITLESCSICLEPIFNSTKCTIQCGHTFHTHCAWRVREHERFPRCPLCRIDSINYNYGNCSTPHDDNKLNAMRRTGCILGLLCERTGRRFEERRTMFLALYNGLNTQSKVFFNRLRSFVQRWFDVPGNVSFSENVEEFEGMLADDLNWSNVEHLEKVLEADNEDDRSTEEEVESSDLSDLNEALARTREVLRGLNQ